MRISNLVITVLLLSGAAHAEQATVWIGMTTPTGGEREGIYRATLDEQTGALDRPVLAAAVRNPEFLALDANGARLYAACHLENGSGGVAVFKVAGDRRSLQFLNAEPTGGGQACHLATDRIGRCLFSAQYGGGSVSAYPIASDGHILPRSTLVHLSGTGPNHVRQEGPHPHWVGTDSANRYLFVPNLGSDEVVIYELDHARCKLKPHGAGHCPPGSGPRHLVFHPNGRFAYVVNEMKVTVTAFRYDATAGSLTAMQTVDLLPDKRPSEKNTAAEICMHPSGRFLYASIRGDDSVTALRIDPDTGRLSFVQNEAVRGSHPRSIGLDPLGKWLLAAGRDSNTIAVFRIDPETGGLAYSGHIVNSPAPICVVTQAVR
ncbi:MAG TPA: lactonase family protein [Lacipirellulaceae bacterium]|nr:lactonase family protein [Lacipirellulaceae bacterium]